MTISEVDLLVEFTTKVQYNALITADVAQIRLLTGQGRILVIFEGKQKRRGEKNETQNVEGSRGF